MAYSGSGSDLGGAYAEEYSYTATPSEASLDTLEDLLQRFTIDCQPEFALKLRTT